MGNISFWSKLRIRSKILSGLLPAAVIILLIVIISFNANKGTSLDSSEKLMKLVVTEQTNSLNILLADQVTKFQTWTAEDVYGLGVEFETISELKNLLENMLGSAPNFAMFVITDLNGRIVTSASASDVSLRSLAGQTSKTFQKLNKSTKSGIQLLENEYKNVSGFDSPLTLVFYFATEGTSGPNGYLLGFLKWPVIQKRVEEIASTLHELGYRDAQSAIMRAGDVIFLSHSTISRVGSTESLSDNLAKWLKNAVDGSTENCKFDGKSQYLTQSRIADADQLLKSGNLESTDTGSTIRVVSFVPVSNVLSKVNSILLISILIGITGFGLLAFITSVIAKMISNPIRKITEISQDIAAGDLTQSIDIYQGDEVGELAEVFREMSISLRSKAEAAGQIAQGNFSAGIKVASDKDALGNAMVTMRQTLNNMKEDLQETIDAQMAGDIDNRCNPQNFHGAYAELMGGVNSALEAVIDPVLEGIGIMQEYSAGNLERKMRELPGKQMVLTNALNSIRENLQALVNQGLTLAQAAEEGNLSVRADLTKFDGAYKDVIRGMNNIIDNITLPVNETVECLQKIAGGDLTAEVTGDYRGDHAVMKNALNSTLKGLNQILYQVSVVAEQVVSGSDQVADSSQALSQGATEQASSMEEISSSLVEQAAQTKTNAENADQTNLLTSNVRKSASIGSTHMEGMLGAMSDINNSAGNISKIIKVIDEIAFQTNLLALNAAVEAARAGVHGKGFAVVAEEVRNLAQRSAQAAKETTELIEGSISKAKNGSDIASKTAEALTDIVNGITKVTDLVGEIADSSKEQAEGIEQISQSLGQIDQVTQSNTANAEESAAAAEELSGQAASLQDMLAKFKLKNMGTRSLDVVSKHNDNAPKRSGFEQRGRIERPGRQPSKEISPKDIISLDDDEFGSF